MHGLVFAFALVCVCVCVLVHSAGPHRFSFRSADVVHVRRSTDVSMHGHFHFGLAVQIRIEGLTIVCVRVCVYVRTCVRVQR